MFRGTWGIARGTLPFAYGAVTPCGGPFQILRLGLVHPMMRPHDPDEPEERRFGLVPFRSPLLRESFLLSSPEDTEMCQFSSFPSISYVFRNGLFGNPRIKACLQLPEAYRS